MTYGEPFSCSDLASVTYVCCGLVPLKPGKHLALKGTWCDRQADQLESARKRSSACASPGPGPHLPHWQVATPLWANTSVHLSAWTTESQVTVGATMGATSASDSHSMWITDFHTGELAGSNSLVHTWRTLIHTAAQDGLKLGILLAQSLECWDSGYVPPHPRNTGFFEVPFPLLPSGPRGRRSRAD